LPIRYEGQKTYELKVAGFTRQLPILPVTDGLWIAAFISYTDIELLNACAQELVERLKNYDFDTIVTVEAKAIPLAYKIAEIMRTKDFVIVRKDVKAYMQDPIVDVGQSITTAGEQKYVIDGNDRGKIEGKRIAIVDDVVSTGGTVEALKRVIEKLGGNIVCIAAVLKEESPYNEPLEYLEELPIFTR